MTAGKVVLHGGHGSEIHTQLLGDTNQMEQVRLMSLVSLPLSPMSQ